jgi:hypothetical protein
MCIDANINISNRNISNHSIRGTGLQELCRLGVSLNERMDFSGHRSQAGANAYTKATDEQRFTTASLLIPKNINSNYQGKFYIKYYF